MSGRMDGAPTSAACAVPALDVCRPRVRRRLVVVGASDVAAAMIAAAADRLATQVEHCADSADAARTLSAAKVACFLLVPEPDSDPLAALERLKLVCRDVPIVVLGCEIDPALAVAAVQAGAQDYVLESEVEPAGLERSIRYAIDRKRTEVQLAHLAHHDQLTGLPNRALFVERLDRALDGRCPEAGPAVLFADVDGFKRINDHLGHRAGDEALCRAAERIGAVVRPRDTLAR